MSHIARPILFILLNSFIVFDIYPVFIFFNALIAQNEHCCIVMDGHYIYHQKSQYVLSNLRTSRCNSNFMIDVKLGGKSD